MKVQLLNWQFEPKLVTSLVTVFFFVVLLKLGFWQLDRADQKSRMEASYISHLSDDPDPINDLLAAKDWHSAEWRSVKADGEFASTNILLDNQIVDGTAGYFVFTPFKLSASPLWVMVNRGWVPMGNSRSQIPPVGSPHGTTEIIARVTDIPPTGLFLGKNAIEVMSDSVLRAQRIHIDEMSAYLKHNFVPFVLRLEPESDNGFVRQWPLPGFGQEKHLGYAFQWFALAGTLLAIYLIVNIKKVGSGE